MATNDGVKVLDVSDLKNLKIICSIEDTNSF